MYRCKELRKVVYSTCRKISHICPDNKNKGQKGEKSNYRPIAVLSCMSRKLEKIMCRSLYEYCVSHELLNRENLRYKRNDSTVNQLRAITHNIYKSLDSYIDACGIFLDVSKAFDKVWHDELIDKLRQLGITGTFICTVGTYINISSWVPQGSIYGHFLFLTYTNDINYNILSSITLFVDDTAPFKEIYNPLHAFRELNNDTETLNVLILILS